MSILTGLLDWALSDTSGWLGLLALVGIAWALDAVLVEPVAARLRAVRYAAHAARRTQRASERAGAYAAVREAYPHLAKAADEAESKENP